MALPFGNRGLTLETMRQRQRQEAEQMQKRNQEQHQKENERRGTKLQVMQASSSGLLGANESGVGPEWVKNPPGLNLFIEARFFSAEGQSTLVK